MLKIILRFLIVAVIAVGLGMLIYHLNQPAASASFGSAGGFGTFSREFGERGFGEGSFSLSRGMFGIVGNLILVAIVTVVVVSLQKALSYRSEPARSR